MEGFDKLGGGKYTPSTKPPGWIGAFYMPSGQQAHKNGRHGQLVERARTDKVRSNASFLTNGRGLRRTVVSRFLLQGQFYGYGLCRLPDFFPFPARAKIAWTLWREKRAYLPHMEKSSPHLRYSAADAPPRRRKAAAHGSQDARRRSPRIEQGAFARFHAKKMAARKPPAPPGLVPLPFQYYCIS